MPLTRHPAPSSPGVLTSASSSCCPAGGSAKHSLHRSAADGIPEPAAAALPPSSRARSSGSKSSTTMSCIIRPNRQNGEWRSANVGGSGPRLCRIAAQAPDNRSRRGSPQTCLRHQTRPQSPCDLGCALGRSPWNLVAQAMAAEAAFKRAERQRRRRWQWRPLGLALLVAWTLCTALTSFTVLSRQPSAWGGHLGRSSCL